MTEKIYKFKSYYKYNFTFVADDGEEVIAGGGSDDIYRADVWPEMTLEQIKSELGEDNLFIVPKPKEVK